MILNDHECDAILRLLESPKLDGYELLSRHVIRHVATKLHLVTKPTSPYALFLFREYFRENSVDLVTLLGDVVRDES